MAGTCQEYSFFIFASCEPLTLCFEFVIPGKLRLYTILSLLTPVIPEILFGDNKLTFIN